MADNVAITAGTGTTVAADDVGGVLHQRVKATWGPDGTANDADVASGKALPVQVRSATGLIPIGEPTDAKSTATDTTSASGISIWKQISASVQSLVTGAVPIGSGTAAAAGRVTLASDDPTFTAGNLVAAQSYQTSGVVTLQSNATGSTYNAFASQACKALILKNDTGVDLEVRLGGAGSTFIVWAYETYTLLGITNASSVGYRRKDTSNTQVTLAAQWVA